MKKMLKKGDITVILFLLVLSGALFLATLRSSEGGSVVIMQKGETVAVLSLDEDTQYVVSNGDAVNIIEISSGKVRMSEASCPDKQCVHQGYISSGGEVIVCLPNRVTIRLETKDNDSAPDAVTR